MRPLDLHLPILLTRPLPLGLALLLAALLLVPATAAQAQAGEIGVCHLTEHGHYEFTTHPAGDLDGHDTHPGDLVGPDVDATDCPGATITPDALLIERDGDASTATASQRRIQWLRTSAFKRHIVTQSWTWRYASR